MAPALLKYIDLAKQSAECFKEYCAQECKVFAAEHAVLNVDGLLEDASIHATLKMVVDEALDGPPYADIKPAHDVAVCMLMSAIDAVCNDFKLQHMYAKQHKDTLAAVGQVLNSIF